MRVHSGRTKLGLVLIVSILVLPFIASNALAQVPTAFSSATKFTIEKSNGVVNFATSGNYSTAILEDNTWVFNGLLLKGSEPLQNLQISTADANVTIESYELSSFNIPSERLNILVQGKGQQVINMGVSAQAGAGDAVNWVVYSNDSFISSGWKVSNNGAITLSSLTGNLSIIFFSFTSQLGNTNEPFYEQHSVAIAVAVAFAVTVAVATTVKIQANKHLKKVDVGQSSSSPTSSISETRQETQA